jgi:O-antigen ligase
MIATASLAAVAVALPVLAALQPVEALVGLAAFAVVLVCALRADLALLLLVAAGPLEAAFQLHSHPQLTLTKVAGALSFGSFALYAIATRRKLMLDRTHVVVLLLFAVAALSTLQAENVSAAVSTTVRYASFAALYLVATQFVGSHSFLRRMAWVLSLASATAAVLAIENFLWGGSYLATLRHGDPNDLGFILATSLPLTFWLLRASPARRPIVLALIGLIAAGLALSFSRGALVGLAAGFVWEVLTERRHVPILLAGGLVAVAATILFVQTNPSRVQSGLTFKKHEAQYNVTTRLDAWNAAANLAAAHPLLGVGPGNFRFHYYDATGHPPGSEQLLVVHNAYLDVAAELGFTGLVLLLLYVGFILARATNAVRRQLGPPGFAAAVRTAFVIAIVGSLTLSEQYYAPLWLLGALITAVWSEGRPTSAEQA